MVKKSVCSALLIGVVLLCMSPAPALARRGFHGHHGFYRHHGHHGHYHRGFSSRVSFHLGFGFPFFYPAPVVYGPPAVVYTSPAVVYTPPPVVQAPPPAASGTLRIVVAPLLADIYLDGRYIGRAQEFPDGQVQLAVSPGSHTVELRLGATAHVHTVSVGAGATVVVSDRLS
jgi:hypothetical protein